MKTLCVATVVAAVVSLAEAQSVRGDGRALWGKWLCKIRPQWCEPKVTCPVVEPVEVNLDEYINKTWYVQKQQPNPYQSLDQLFCVTATYEKQDDSDFLTVLNYANNGAVNGPTQSSDGGFFADLCAQPQESGKGILKVAPCFLRNIGLFDRVGGPYWVVALDPNYEWAVVSGGQPKEVIGEDPVLCTTKIGSSFLDTNGSGLWVFTRAQVADPAVLEFIEEQMVALGISTSRLVSVPQEGCNYEGATIKA